MKTTLDLPDELVRRMKIRAVQEGRPLKRLVAELLSRSLNAADVPAPAADVAVFDHILLNHRGFPVIRCGADAPASRMTAAECMALEQQILLEEDMQRANIPV
ncbi:hypothetical protein FEM03_00435 [Phragmitibacter flavus]|uniref:Antitoxin n=1 Tax=Phragmitibacter flavus TaxID=2576071 RepID=A0A5R8KJZ4_9BACT|nr:hypothetical protein [Phragmitibacter flavus]TLD72577.1 hypothetical protein FEM03_00435 [Phragmitibacter flavus]